MFALTSPQNNSRRHPHYWSTNIFFFKKTVMLNLWNSLTKKSPLLESRQGIYFKHFVDLWTCGLVSIFVLFIAIKKMPKIEDAVHLVQ